MTKLHDICGMTPLLPEHYDALKPRFKNQQVPLCGYSLSAFIMWKTHVYHPAFDISGDDLILARLFPVTPEKSYLVLPVPGGIGWSPDRLKELCIKRKITKVAFIDEAYMEAWGTPNIEAHFTIHEQTDYEDYVYNKEDLAELKGNKYSKKRNLINQFRKTHVETGRIGVEAITAENADECRAFLAHWWSLRDSAAHDDEDSLGEKVACNFALDLVETLPDLRGIAMRVDGKVSAFGLATDLTKEMADFNFQKADPSVKGLYQFFDRQCARMLFDGTHLINKECDMDDPGLRHAKRSYHPALRYKSYKLTLNKVGAS